VLVARNWGLLACFAVSLLIWVSILTGLLIAI
jgi:hypothetical protein